MDKKWYNFKTKFTEACFELKEVNDLDKKNVGFVADDTTYQPHVEETHTVDSLNNITNDVTLESNNLTNLTTTNPSWRNNSRWH